MNLSEQELSNQIEALLFFSDEPLDLNQIGDAVKTDETKIQQSIESLKKRYNDQALDIILMDGKYEIAIKPKYSRILTTKIKDGLNKTDLSPVSLECLSIILCRGPITKLEIEELRGINSSQIIRKLKILGLIKEIVNSESPENPSFDISSDLLKHFGFKNREECGVWLKSLEKK
jgi:segregation and condensation protein B